MKAGYDCIKAFSEIDFTEDLRMSDAPGLYQPLRGIGFWIV